MSSAAKRQIIQALDDLPEQSLATLAELVDLLRAAGPLAPDRVPELGGLSKGHAPAAGSPAAILSATRRLPQLDPAAADELERVIDEPVAARIPQLGTLRGMVDIPDDFDAPLPEELLRGFEGDT